MEGTQQIKNIFFIATTNSSFEKSNYGAKTNEFIATNGITLVFNMGPSFFHLFVANKSIDESFNFHFGSNEDQNLISDKLHKIVELQSIEPNKNSTKLNAKKSTVVKVNIFKEKCICQDCLTKSFLFFGSQVADLREELLRILCSVYCSKWTESWVNVLVEQIETIFNCLKGGIEYEHLLHSAQSNAEKLRIAYKLYKLDLLEYKYSYLYFHKEFEKKVNSLMKSKQHEIKYFLPFKTTGKEELDLIDKILIVSFETEKDLNEYTKRELKYLGKTNTQSALSYHKEDNEIILTKTADITKIKGWKNKLFSKTVVSQEEKPYSTEFVKKGSLDNSSENISATLNEKKKAKQKNEIAVNSNTNLKVSYRLETTSVFLKLHNEKNTVISAITTDSDSDCKVKIVKPLNNIISPITVLHRCGKLCGTSQLCNCKRFTLGMLLTLGNGRPLHKKAKRNLRTLYRTDNIIDERLANIAISALATSCNKKSVTRIIVPVVTKSILSICNNWTEKLNFDLSIENIPVVSNSTIIDPEIRNIVNELVDNAVIKAEEESVNLKSRNKSKVKRNNLQLLKRRRELKKLKPKIKYKQYLTRSRTSTNSHCSRKGCTYRRVSNEMIRHRCGKVSCAFKSTCSPMVIDLTEDIQNDTRNAAEREVVIINVDDSDIEEVIEDGKQFNNNASKVKTGLVEELSNQRKEMEATYNQHQLELATNEEILTYQETRLKFEKYASIKEPLIRYAILRRLEGCLDVNNLEKNLWDVLIYCGDHEKYSCFCTGKIVRLKGNQLKWKPVVTTKQRRSKHLDEEVCYFNPNEHSARTFGTVFNYSVRNKTELFKIKRKAELDQKILVSTNSYTKMKNCYMLSSFCPDLDLITRNTPGVIETLDVVKEDCEILNIKQEDNSIEKPVEIKVCNDSPKKRITNQTGNKLDLTFQMIKDILASSTSSDTKKPVEKQDNFNTLNNISTQTETRGNPNVADRTEVTAASTEIIELSDSDDAEGNEDDDGDIVLIVDKNSLTDKDKESIVQGTKYKHCKVIKASSKKRCNERIIKDNSKDKNNVSIVDDCSKNRNSEKIFKDSSYVKNHVKIINSPKDENNKTIIKDHSKISSNEKINKTSFGDIYNSLHNNKIRKVSLNNDSENVHEDNKEADESNKPLIRLVSLEKLMAKKHINDDNKTIEIQEEKTNEKFKEKPINEQKENSRVINPTEEVDVKRRRVDNISNEDPLIVNIPKSKEEEVSENCIIPDKNKSSNINKYRNIGKTVKVKSEYLNKIYGSDDVPKLALLCLTPGIGYIPIYEFNSEMLCIQHPIKLHEFHRFLDLKAANKWLNIYFKKHLTFENPQTNLKWVIVKAGIIRLKKALRFSEKLFESSTYITKEGGLQVKTNQLASDKSATNADNPLCISKNDTESDKNNVNIQIKRKLQENSSDEFDDNKKIKLLTSPTRRIPNINKIVTRTVPIFQKFPINSNEDCTQDKCNYICKSLTISPKKSVNNFGQNQTSSTVTTTVIENKCINPLRISPTKSGQNQQITSSIINNNKNVIKNTPLTISPTKSGNKILIKTNQQLNDFRKLMPSDNNKNPTSFKKIIKPVGKSVLLNNVNSSIPKK